MPHSLSVSSLTLAEETSKLCHEDASEDYPPPLDSIEPPCAHRAVLEILQDGVMTHLVDLTCPMYCDATDDDQAEESEEEVASAVPEVRLYLPDLTVNYRMRPSQRLLSIDALENFRKNWRQWRLLAARQVACIESMERAQKARQEGVVVPVGGAAEAATALESLGLPVSLQVAHELLVDDTFRFNLATGSKGSLPSSSAPTAQRMAARSRRKEALERFHSALESIRDHATQKRMKEEREAKEKEAATEAESSEAEGQASQEDPVTPDSSPLRKAAPDTLPKLRPALDLMRDAGEEVKQFNFDDATRRSEERAESLSMVAAMLGEKVVFERVLELREALMDLGIAAMVAGPSLGAVGQNGSQQGSQECGLGEVRDRSDCVWQRNTVASDVSAILDPILILQMLAHESFTGWQALAIFDKVATVVQEVSPDWISAPYVKWWRPMKQRLERMVSNGEDLIEEIPFVFEECLEELWQGRLDIANIQLPWVCKAIRSEGRGIEFECFHLTQLLSYAKEDINLLRTRRQRAMQPPMPLPPKLKEDTLGHGTPPMTPPMQPVSGSGRPMSPMSPIPPPPPMPPPLPEACMTGGPPPPAPPHTIPQAPESSTWRVGPPPSGVLPLSQTLKWIDQAIENLIGRGRARESLNPREVHDEAMLAILADRRPPILLPGEASPLSCHPSPSCGIQRLPEVLALDAERVATWHASAQRIALVGALGTVIFQVLKDNKVEISEEETLKLKEDMLRELDHAGSLQAALSGICTSVHMIAADRGKWIAARHSSIPGVEENTCQARLSSSLSSAADPKGPLRALLHKRVITLVSDALKTGLKPAAPEDTGPLAELRKSHTAGRRTGLCLMMLEIEELLQGSTRACRLHRGVHAPLIQGIISSYKPIVQKSSVESALTPRSLMGGLLIAMEEHAQAQKKASATGGATAVEPTKDASQVDADSHAEKDPSQMFWMAIG